MSETPKPRDPESRKERLDLDHYGKIKDETLLKHGLPESELPKVNCILAVFASHLSAGKPGDPTLVYVEEDGTPLAWESFNNEEEFDEACKKTVGHYRAVQESRLAGINELIQEFREKVPREWTHDPEEEPGDYEFDGEFLATSSVMEILREDEVGLLLAYIKKRILENNGAGRFQTFTASDGKVVWAKDHLDRKMKASGDFKPEHDYFIFYRPAKN